MRIFNISHHESLEKYLDCPIFQGRPSKNTFQDTISKAMTKLVGWKGNSLSKAGRIILIQSHLESIPTYTMQCFYLPKPTSTHLNKLHTKFF